MDRRFMERALELALGGLGKVSPNPMVGAVIIKEDKIIGEGFHGFYGDKHAEVHALNSCETDVRGADLYCNLEPCSTAYTGKINPPCCDAIIKAGISRVFIGQLDPNPKVSGTGVKRLRNAGVEVYTGILEEEALELNRGFNSVMTVERPYIHLKWAQTLDGQIATKAGVSKWISSEECRKETHYYRSLCDAILVGRNTITEDDPALDARYGFSPSPRPVVIDAKLKTDPKSKIFTRNPIIFTNRNNRIERREMYSGEFALLEGSCFPLTVILDELKNRGVNSLFVEGGSDLLTQFLEAGLWDRITIYTAPKILGEGISPVGVLPIDHPKDSITFKKHSFKILDNHMVFNGWREEAGLCLQA